MNLTAPLQIDLAYDNPMRVNSNSIIQFRSAKVVDSVPAVEMVPPLVVEIVP